MEGEARKLLTSSSAGSEFLQFLAGIWSWVAHKFDQPLCEFLHFLAGIWSWVVHKFDQPLCEFLHFLAGIWSWVVHKFDQLLPPETRSETLHHWAHVGLTVVLPVSLVLLCLYCCCCRRPCACLCRCRPRACLPRCRPRACLPRCRPRACLPRCRPPACLRRCFSYFVSCCSKSPLEFEAPLMKAPGRGGARMPRGVFEGNPRGYFRDLRANKDLPKFW